MLTTRDKLHHLVDAIPEGDLEAAERALEEIARRPSLADLFANAPECDEELDPEEEAAIAEAETELEAGLGLTSEELRRELGLMYRGKG